MFKEEEDYAINLSEQEEEKIPKNTLYPNFCLAIQIP
jgi:hypothetical protein